MFDLSVRRRQEEWMDRPDVDPAELRRSLRFIRLVNSWLRYTRATIGHLEQFSRGWEHGETIRMIDIATGSADVPIAIVRWAQRRGFDVRAVGVDLHPITLSAAAIDAGADRSRIELVRGDATSLPFANGSFDYALCSMFLHHLSEEQVVQVLREMDRVARRGVIVADLIRNRRAYAWISLLSWPAGRMVYHDGRASVAQAFNRKEIEHLRDEAGLAYARYHRHFGHRFVLAGEKNTNGRDTVSRPFVTDLEIH